MGGGKTWSAHSPILPSFGSVRTRVKAPQLPHRPSYSVTGIDHSRTRGTARGMIAPSVRSWYAPPVHHKSLPLLAILALGCAESATVASRPASPPASAVAPAPLAKAAPPLRFIEDDVP